jgi:aryl-alcohol dehydrogenase-like predicted oxidoreductase
MVRGPLRRGLLSGKYDLDSVFTDDVRDSWNKGGARRDQYEAEVAKVEALKSRYAPGEAMVNAAIRYVISHPADPVAIPGAKSPLQARMNAAVGDKLFSAEELAEVRQLLE